MKNKFKRLLSRLFFFTGFAIACFGLYQFYFGPEGSWFAQLAWLPAIGVLAAFWADHRMLLGDNKSLKKQTQFKSDFINVLSHDIKTPLARIKAMLDVIASDMSQMNYEQKLALAQIEKSQVELTNFIDSMVQMSHLEGGKISLNLKSQDINQLINDVVKESKFVSTEKNIEIMMDLEPLFTFKFDKALVKQVLQNLVENSLKYSKSHSKIMISTQDKGENIVIQISDEGFGISQKDLPFVFDRYFRSQHAKTWSTKSSGLGLYLAKEFIKMHKGQIEVQSEEGVGSTFTVTLPKNRGALDE